MGLARTADSAISKNQDALKRWRRRRSSIANVILEEKQFTSVFLGAAPERDGMDLLRKYTWSHRRIPTREQIQAWATSQGQPMKYSEVAPLLRAFRKSLLDACVGVEVVAKSSSRAEFEGTLASWSEKNEHWDMQLLAGAARYQLTSPNDITVAVGEEVAVWLWE